MKFDVSSLQAPADFVFGQHAQRPPVAGLHPSALRQATVAPTAGPVAQPGPAQQSPAAANLFAGGPDSSTAGGQASGSAILPAGQAPSSPYTPINAGPYQTPTFGRPPAAPAFGFAPAQQQQQQQGVGEPFVFRGAMPGGELPSYISGLGEETPATGTTAGKRAQQSIVVRGTAQKKGKATPGTKSAKKMRLSAKKAPLSTATKKARRLRELAAEEAVTDHFAAATSLVRRPLSRTPGERVYLQLHTH